MLLAQSPYLPILRSQRIALLNNGRKGHLLIRSPYNGCLFLLACSYDRHKWGKGFERYTVGCWRRSFLSLLAHFTLAGQRNWAVLEPGRRKE
jgi:hypothetical protein